MTDIAGENSVKREETGLDRGSNQSGMRAYNERLVLTLIRRSGPLAKAEIARRSGLSAQTVSVIMRALEVEGLLLKCDPLRGKVGQPSVPMRLAPDGALFLGLKVGRRSTDLLLTDFTGKTLGRVRLTYRYPTPETAVKFANKAIRQLMDQLDARERGRIAGLGIAMPFQLWEWAGRLGVDPSIMDAWRRRDIREEIAKHWDFPIFLQNDASAACGAELVFGEGEKPRDFLYFYIGYFIGGGIVLNGSLYTGRTGNAGALGSIPVMGQKSKLRQLIDIASLSALEEAVEADAGNADAIWQNPQAWSIEPAVLANWIDKSSSALALSIGAAAAVIDFECAMIDGWIPVDIRSRIVGETEKKLAGMTLAGMEKPAVRSGTIGADARTLGAACLPLSERFLVDQNALLKPES